MLSSVARFAAIATIAAGALSLASPRPAAAATRALACGDPGVHTCCIEDTSCGTGTFCCAFNGTELLPGGCGCGT